MGTLDRKRPFGSVTSDPEGRAFEQDGVFYRADGSAWTPAEADVDALVAAPAKAAGKKKAAAETPPAALDEQLDAQMGAA